MAEAQIVPSYLGKNKRKAPYQNNEFFTCLRKLKVVIGRLKRTDVEEEGRRGKAGEELEKCVARWQRLCLAEEGMTDRGWLECSVCVCVCVWMKQHTPSPILLNTPLHLSIRVFSTLLFDFP